MAVKKTTAKAPAKKEAIGKMPDGSTAFVGGGSTVSTPTKTVKTTTPAKTSGGFSGAPVLSGKFMDGSGFDEQGNAYTVKPTDTAVGIAKKNKISVPALIQANKDSNGAVGTNISIPKGLKMPTTIQNTAAQRAADLKTQADYQNILTSQNIIKQPETYVENGVTYTRPPMDNPVSQPAPVTNAQAVKVDPKSAISNLYLSGVTNPTDIYKELSKTVENIDSTTISDEVARLSGDSDSFITGSQNAAIKEQMMRLDKNQAKFDVEIEKMKKDLTAENKAAVESIRANSEKARGLLKTAYENNRATLNKANYQTDAFRYTPQQAENQLVAQETDFIVNMAAIDSQEKSLLLQAAQAKSEGNWKLLSEQVAQFNKTGDDKRALIKEMIDVTATHLKTVQEEAKLQAKAIADAMLSPTEVATTVKTIAPAVLATLKSMPDQASKDAYIESKAKELGVSIDALNSALHTQMSTEAEDLVKNATAEARLIKANATANKATAPRVSNPKPKPSPKDDALNKNLSDAGTYLDNNLGEDGYTDPRAYQEALKRLPANAVAPFKAKYKNKLSPAERKRLGT